MTEIYKATEKHNISDSQKPEKRDSSLLVAAGAYTQALRNGHCFPSTVGGGITAGVLLRGLALRPPALGGFYRLWINVHKG